MLKRKLSVISAALFCTACSVEIQTDDHDKQEPNDYPDQVETTAEKIFPVGLAASSPFIDEIDTQTDTSAASAQRPLGTVPHYIWATRRIARVLNGMTPLRDDFMVEAFYRRGHNANCFGPEIAYQGHVDATSSDMEDGTLPSGDVGIWLTSADNGQACSVAQTNSLLRGVQSQSRMALMTLASMVSTAIAEGESLPTDGESLDLTVAMDNLGLSDINFTSAVISRADDAWVYSVEFAYQVDGHDYDIWLEMNHMPGSDISIYDGNLSYLVEGEVGVAGIEFQGGNCALDERSLAGSLSYSRDGSDIALQARTATLCGHDVSNAFNADGLVDVDNLYDSVSNPDGWSENFAIFGANFSQQTIEGEYTYVWQAGAHDSHSRIITVGLNDPDLANGEAHYGYGDTIDNTDGWIKGFICNWAGPNNDHTLQPYTQRQHIDYDESTGLYDGTAHRANIAYAPTNSCDYDGLASFVFDIDASGALGDIADESADLAYANDLWASSDTTLSVPEALQARGIDVPEIPFGWPADE
ncbi:hypothetical protein [Catenovulum sediminis]|uniref:Lipoprotein n=1 Tax=Catenovulum sediminis TaxID=1740262 RepID=A0ABV1RI11_9ALTE